MQKSKEKRRKFREKAGVSIDSARLYLEIAGEERQNGAALILNGAPCGLILCL
jgi:hypothetical protein